MATDVSPITTVSSSADMMAGITNDLFAGISAAPEEAVDTAVDDAPAEETAGDDATSGIEAPPADGDEDAIEEPADEETPAVEASDDAQEVKPADGEEELPEGVRKGKGRNGKDGFFLEENRYKTFHGSHKLAQQAAELIGEPLTAEALKLRNDAYLAQERLFSNLSSGDPTAQSDVLNYILKEMKSAQENGEVGVDPTVPFAESVYAALRDGAPDAYAHLRMRGASDLVGEMFDKAARSGDLDLFSAVQHISAAVANVGAKPPEMSDQEYAALVRERTTAAGVPFYTHAERQGIVRPEDPLAAAQKKIAELESKVNGRSQANTTEQFDTWSRNNVKEVNTAVLDDAVKPSLASVEAGWKDFPADYKRLVVDPLHREVVAAVKGDPVLDQQIKELQVRARRATSEQVRQQLGGQIKQLVVNRANRAAEASKAPIVKFAADWLKGRSDQTHERRTSAQTRTTPKGPGAPVKTSLVPPNVGFENGVYDSKVAYKQMQALMQ